MKYSIVILNKFPEYARNLIASIKKTHQVMPDILVVCDNHEETIEGCQQIYWKDPFIYARNANVGIKACQGDVILCNDDMECVERDFFPKLRAAAWLHPRCGILSPLIDGGVGCPLQMYSMREMWEKHWPDTISVVGTHPEAVTVCFPCVWLSRRMIDAIGPLDEAFTGYGFEDADYCIRARQAGWLTMINKSLRIKHGIGGNGLNRGYNWSCSFSRVAEKPSNHDYFMKKHSPELIAAK